MTEPNEPTPRTESDDARQGFTVLAALGIAVFVIVAGGVVGASVGMRGGNHTMAWGAPGARFAPGGPTATGFQLTGMPASMVEHYTYARENADVYEQVPCFCGCQSMLGHRNLEDCFVTPDGAWESHASGCQVCTDESQMVMRMMSRGMDPGTMHDRIVAEYGGPMMGTSAQGSGT
ncbi:MAG: PCYCGC motif-containing (lipo)protein [Actinomycetota bacterium]